MYQVEDIRMLKKCTTPSDGNKKLKTVIEETLSKYNSLLMHTIAEEGYGDGKKVQMLSEFIDDLNAVKKVCVDRNRF